MLSFCGENTIYIINAPKIRRRLAHLLRLRVQTVVLNLEGITFIDSSGFSMIMQIAELAKYKGKRFCLSGISEELLELFRLVKLDSTFGIHTLQDPGVVCLN